MRYEIVMVGPHGSVFRMPSEEEPSLDHVEDLIKAPKGHIRVLFLRGLTDIPMWCEDCAPDVSIKVNLPVTHMIDRDLQPRMSIRGSIVMVLDRRHKSWDWGQTFLRGVAGWRAFHQMNDGGEQE